MISKSKVYKIFPQFQALVERQFLTKIKSIQTDWGGEYHKLHNYFVNMGIRHRLSCHYTHEQNSLVEHRNRYIVETGLSILAQGAIHGHFWHFAFKSVVYLINRLPSKVSHNITHFQCVYKYVPVYKFLKVFGCLCYPFLRPYHKNKMEYRSSPCVFLSYNDSYHGYSCMDLKTN